jgi:NAD+ kinase
MRVLIIANTVKPHVRPALDEMLPWLNKRVDVAGVDSKFDAELSHTDVDAILVLGGDGTLLAAARRLAGRQIPLMGVNFGRLGFLASFTPAEFRTHFDAFVEKRLPVSARLQIEASVLPAGVMCALDDPVNIAVRRRFVATALNDAVITAGSPFHMVQLRVGADGPDGESGVEYFGDGMIIATASGSTAYNVAAGGPIISPSVDALCITPICPHSLSFRPVVVSANAVVAVGATRVNEGTTLFCDGQENTRLHVGETVVIRRSPNPVLLVENPDVREWRTLAEKLHWAATPGYQPTPPTR